MSISIQLFECEFCGKQYKTENGVNKHELTCSENPENNAQLKTKNVIDEKIEEIRVTAENPHHLIEMLQALWLEYGIKVTFNSYPSNFDLMVSNSHNSPRGYNQNWRDHGDEQGTPKGYPGWVGSWKGTVEIINNKLTNRKTEYFSSLLGGGWGGLMNCWFIQTGSGGCGNDFSYGGMLFLYDFPKMHDEFIMSGGEYDLLNDQYHDTVKSYNAKYNKELKNTICFNKESIKLKSLQEQLKKSSDILYKMNDQLNSSITNEFNEQYKVVLSLPKSAFDKDNEEVMKTRCKVQSKKSIVHPELDKIFKNIESLVKQIDGYKDEHPELFI